jgi:outer membrane protein
MPEAIGRPLLPTNRPHITSMGPADLRLWGTPILAWPKIVPTRAIILLLVLFYANTVFAQDAPDSPYRQWIGPGEQQIKRDAELFNDARFSVDPAKPYSLAELIDFAQEHNPETRFAWERARAQAAALGVARSELYPTLAAAALSQTNRDEVLFGSSFFRQTIQTFQVAFDLNYTVFDFGARAGRIDAARAEVLAANFRFNDTHRNIIYRVEKSYYELLNAFGQVDAARTSLSNAQTVQRAAEDRLKQGLGTLPDVLEARSATAQAQFELQAVLGAKEIAGGDLATTLGVSPSTIIYVQPINDLPVPESIGGSVEQAINRAFVQRPDLLQQVAEIRAANARVKEARAAYYPSFNLGVGPTPQTLFGLQRPSSWTHIAGLAGGVGVTLKWTVSDGGRRRSKLAEAQANLRAAEAQVNVTRDQIANEIWAAYSNLNTAFLQRQAAIALLESASQSYAAALESYNYGVRSLLDVTAAQRTLAQAQSTDVQARARVLSALAELAFQIRDKRP